MNHVLPQRDQSVLCETGKLVNPDDASGAALEDALGEVAIRKQRSGAPDEWELRKEAWDLYDPAFYHISTRAHQSATEYRPKPPPSMPYAPRPSVAHSAFRRIRRDLTADSCILAVVYRVLHVHCYQNEDSPPSSDPQLPGNKMYDEEIKSETALARAVHLLTLGSYSWEDPSLPTRDRSDSTSWKDMGGGEIGSVFHQRESAPAASDWVAMALLREPSEVMNCDWYRGKENALTLLRMIGSEGGNHSGFLGGLDPALRSGASYLCDFAARVSPTAATLLGRKSEAEEAAVSKEDEMEAKKKAAKEKAMAMMKAQMAKFAANIGGFDADDDNMSEDLDGSRSPSRGSDEPQSFSTPVRRRSDSEAENANAMELSPAGSVVLTSPFPSTPYTPHTPRTPHSSGRTTPGFSSQHSVVRLLSDRPQCIVCGADMQIDDSSDGKKLADASLDEDVNQEKALAFCGYAQASTVIKGGFGVPSQGAITTVSPPSHVGVHVTLCGHAIHKGCCDAYLKSITSQRDDRLEGGKRREFRCPLCQRLSNCLVPFVDVAADWLDTVSPSKANTTQTNSALKSEEEVMSIDSMSSSERSAAIDGSKTGLPLHEFLSKSKWWTTRNDSSLSWDGQCAFSAKSDDPKPTDMPILSSPRHSLKKIHVKFGKKELISAWNTVLRTPRLVKRRARSFSLERSPAIPTLDQESELRQRDSSSDVLRRFMDQISDVAHRADMRRLGEDVLFNDFGEFRHYLSEKAIYNKVNRALGKEIVDVSASVYATTWNAHVCSNDSSDSFITLVAYMPFPNVFDGVTTPGAISRETGVKATVFYPIIYIHLLFRGRRST